MISPLFTPNQSHYPEEHAGLQYGITYEAPSLEFNPKASIQSKVVAMSELTPLFFKVPANASPYIALYLNRLINQQHMSPGCCLLLPSLESLTHFYNVPYTEVQKAFQKLKMQGHEYLIPGYYGNISVWPHTLPVSEQRHSQSNRKKRFSNIFFIKSNTTVY